MEFAHSTSHLHSPYPPRPPTITGQIILRSALTDRFQHLLDPCYRYSTPYTQPSHIDGTAFIDLSLLPTFHRGHCYTLTFLALFSNSLPPRPSVLSVTLGTSNRITIESICAPPPRRITTSPPSVRLSLGLLPQEYHIHSQSRSLVYQNP